MADHDEETIVDATPNEPVEAVPAERTTGPLRRLWPFGKRGPDQNTYSVEEAEETDDFKRQRRLIENFNEDYLTWADRAKLSAAKFVAFMLPVAAVAAVGTDIGAFFTPALGAFSSYTLSYAIEAGIAALTIMLGMAAQKTNEPTGHWVKVAVAALVWLVASLASGLVMYVIAAAALPAATLHTNLGSAVIFLRTFAVMLIDLLSVCILFFRGKTLQRYINEQTQRSHAITTVNEAELGIKRAQEMAEMRRREDAQYLEGKQRQFEVVAELTEMTNQALLDVARRNLLRSPDEGNNRRIGRY